MNNKRILKFIVLTLFLFNLALSQKKCKILALSGGGDLGAYQAGAISGLVNNLPPEEVKWDVVSGISIGSLNGIMVAVNEIGNEVDMAKKMLEEWRQIDGTNAIYENWWLGGVVRGLLYESGLYNTSPGYDFVRNVLKKHSGLKREIVLGATDVKTGGYKIFRNQDLKNDEDIVQAGMCSAAFPVVFPFGNFKGTIYTDGGVRYGTDIPSAVHICQDKGFEDKDIILDVVLCSGDKIDEIDPNKLTPIPILMRYFDINDFAKTMGDLEDAEHFLKEVTFRYIVAPTQTLPSGSFPLVFKPEQIEQMIQLGEKDAKQIVGEGMGIHYKMLKDKIYEQKQKRHNRAYKKIIK
jgi:predicted patatin/cPLA2 family phospholipase